MAKIHETTMALRFSGNDLDPNEITSCLGCQPTVGAKMGEVSITKRGTEKTARTGTWRLISDKVQPGDLNAQVAKLLSQLNDDLSVWKDLTARFQADVFCGMWMEESNEAAFLSAETMMSLSCRNLAVWLVIYDSSSD